jgi:hypothetical protein
LIICGSVPIDLDCINCNLRYAKIELELILEILTDCRILIIEESIPLRVVICIQLIIYINEQSIIRIIIHRSSLFSGYGVMK